MAAASSAHASAFGGGGVAKLEERIANLERALSSFEKKEGGGSKVAGLSEGEANGLGTDGESEEEVSSEQLDKINDRVAETYELLGQMNELYVINDFFPNPSDPKRLLLTESEFHEFSQDRKNRVMRELKIDPKAGKEPMPLPEPPSATRASATAARANNQPQAIKPTARERAEERKRQQAEKARAEAAEKEKAASAGYRAPLKNSTTTSAK